MEKQKLWFLATVLVVALVLTACSGDSEDAADNGDQSKEKTRDAKTSLQVIENEKVGKHLADSKGMSLYIFTKDKKGVSNCKGKCLKNWPAFYTKDVNAPEGYDKSNFGTITRQDTGEKQTTYRGYPLYYFVKDKEKGDVNGQGVKDVWYVVNDQTFQKHINKGQSALLSAGIGKVLSTLQDLKNTAASSPDNAKKINEKGKTLSEIWEPIEKDIEKHNAKAYENIEKSLYPLIAESKKNQPDVNKVKQLVDETADKLKQFKKKITSAQQVTQSKGSGNIPLVYVNERDANVVQVINSNNNKVIDTIKVGKKPTYNEVSPNGKYDYVVNSGSENVSIINTHTNQVVKTIPVGKTPKGVNFTPNGKWAYVINEGEGTVTAIDTQSKKPVGKIEVGKSPHNGVSSPDSSKFYVTNTGSNSVSVIDTSTQKVVNTIKGVNGSPHNINITPDGKTLLVSLTGKNAAGVIDLGKNKIVKTIPTGIGHHVIDITPDGKYAYMANIGTDFVSVIDLSKREKIKEITVGTGPHGITVTANGDKVYVAVSVENEVAVIDTTKNEVVNNITTKEFPFFVSTIEGG
ncbi:YVTN family beta-propeller repeat protein [Virgibacillus siamensis]|uniref:YVTN family beta-propeller repeat protein n=1 Tax=Virgibacillus siamensis TaxID=480071 RepID=UPI000986037F